MQGGMQAPVQSDDPWIPLLYAYLWADDRGREDMESYTLELLASAVSRLEHGLAGPALWGGLAGIAWVNAHIEREFVTAEPDPATAGPPIEPDDEDEEEAGPALDRLLIERVRNNPPGEYDLISGLAGIGVLGLERLHAGTGADLVDAVVDELARRVMIDEPGLTLLTPPGLLPPWQRKIAPDGYLNLGVAHGVPGVICFLAQACAAGRMTEKVAPLLEGLVAWTVAHRDRNARRGGGFTGWVLPGQPRPEHEGFRSAWCYGGLGVGAALVLAGRVAGNSDWLSEGIAICLAEAEVPVERSGVIDAGLCHGAAGNAHVFNRLFQTTGEERFRDAALRYYGRVLEYADDTRGIGGYVAYGATPGAVGNDGPPELSPVDDASFLTGSTGIGLALLASVSDVEPQWDRVLLMNMPPRP